MWPIVGYLILAVVVGVATWRVAGRALWRRHRIDRIRRQLALPRAAGNRLRPLGRAPVSADLRFKARVAYLRSLRQTNTGMGSVRGGRL